MVVKRVLVFPFLVAFTACVSTRTQVPETWLSVPQAPRMRSLTLDAAGKVAHTPEKPPRRTQDGPIRIADQFTGPKLANGEKILTEPFAAIDSFDYSESRGEVAFSARRGTGFDVGLVSSDGSPISWLPPDPSDELAVQWAPRGNKVSYVLRLGAGDVVRTLHVPTAVSMAVTFDGGAVHALAWDPAAERFAVSYSTPDASDRVEVMKYSGAERKVVVPPAERLNVELEPFGGALLLRPRDLRYDEKLPLVVWSADDLSWSDARAALLRNARVAVVVATRAPGEELWRAVEATPWLDAKRLCLVGSFWSAGSHPARRRAESPSLQGEPIVITTDPALPPNLYHRSGRTVTVAPAVVQSFAAGFIADQLKRTSPTNGSSR
jgi:hypothetical protein